jgi:ATP-dependent RNA helicase RhlE
MNFDELNLIPSILRALEDENYTTPTPIQAISIPIALSGEDILGSAQTGTGKTAAFALPIIQKLSLRTNQAVGRRKISSLIVTPTRELAIQIGENITAYARYTPIRNTVIYGGVNQSSQTKALKQGVDILVATPGRLLDLMNQGHISLHHVQYFVIDEVDRMFDMGFIADVKRIISHLPHKRQSLFFSATLPKNIMELAKTILTNPKKVAVNPVSSTGENIKQLFYKTNRNDKAKLLLHILKNPNLDQVLLFSRTKHGADRIVRNLKKEDISCMAIHGNKSQHQRQKALKAFKDGEVRVLVGTDIAARGIDIDRLNYVINFDIPSEPETYVHRIGRCGRAGEKGTSISICEPEENAYLKAIEKLTHQKATFVDSHPYPQTEEPMSDQEKKEFRREKERKKREYFANRKKKDGRINTDNRRKKRR